MPHLSHRGAETDDGELRRALRFEHPALAAIAVLTVLCDEGDAVLTVGAAGARLEAVAPVAAVRTQRVASGDVQALWAAIGPRTRGVVVSAAEADDEMRALLDETDAVLVIDGTPTAPAARALVVADADVTVGSELPATLARRLTRLWRACASPG